MSDGLVLMPCVRSSLQPPLPPCQALSCASCHRTDGKEQEAAMNPREASGSVCTDSCEASSPPLCWACVDPWVPSPPPRVRCAVRRWRRDKEPYRHPSSGVAPRAVMANSRCRLRCHGAEADKLGIFCGIRLNGCLPQCFPRMRPRKFAVSNLWYCVGDALTELEEGHAVLRFSTKRRNVLICGRVLGLHSVTPQISASA